MTKKKKNQKLPYFAFLDENITNNVECTNEIVALTKQFTIELKEIKKKYPDVGIGDTQSDELITLYITDCIYDTIHG